MEPPAPTAAAPAAAARAEPPKKSGKAVVVLGAGSSADFGVPTLATLFKDTHSRRYLQQDKALEAMLRETFWRPRGHDLETSDKSLTIEEMLTVLRDWEQATALHPDQKPREVEVMKRKLYVLIYKAVFEGKSSQAKHLNPIIHFCRTSLERTTWASFNWDCMFESSFYYSSGGPGPYQRSNPNLVIKVEGWRQGFASHELLKLHGSINWWLVNDKLMYLSFAAGGPLVQKWNQYAAETGGDDCPVILEPSSYKYTDERYKQLEPQWHKFFDRLLEADFIIVIGYSLPEADTMARSKMLTAFQVNEKARWLIVDPNNDVCSRYRRLLGDQRVTVLQSTLAGFNNAIIDNLRQAFPDINVVEE